MKLELGSVFQLRIFCGSLILLALSSFAHSPAQLSLTTRTFGPKSEVIVKKLNLIWEAWPEGDNAVTKASVSLDGKKVFVKYDKVNRRIFYPIDQPLSLGSHRVEMELFVNNWAKFRKEWNFTVSGNALDSLPLPDDSAREILAAANAKRSEAGLEPYILDPGLCLATKLHAEYIQLNKSATHDEVIGQPGFSGATIQDRAERVGNTESTWEVLANEVEDIDVGLSRLFDAPYHRISLMQPGSLPIGGSLNAKVLVIDGHVSSLSRIVVSPNDGQKDIPILWNDKEAPDPLRLGRLYGAIGYPIVFSYFTSSAETINLVSAKLTDDKGNLVKIFVNHPQIDEFLTNSIIILPVEKLAESTQYTVDIAATDSKGKSITKTWSFTTG